MYSKDKHRHSIKYYSKLPALETLILTALSYSSIQIIRNKPMSFWRYPLFLLLLLGFQNIWAAETLTLGVFKYRPEGLLLQRYQPMANYLGNQLGVKVELRVLDQDQIEEAIQAGQLDLVFTNPTHYVSLLQKYDFTGALVTLVSLTSGQPTSQLGGVIVTRADNLKIQTLADLKGERILIPGTRFLGGYQTQAYELLQAGIRLPRDAQVIEAGSHDAVIKKLLNNEGNVGFVRTGIIEELIAEGKLDQSLLRIVTPREYKFFPYLVSTRLYPEWAMVAMPHIKKDRLRKLAVALMTLDPLHPDTQMASFGGFEPPQDYSQVEDIMRALRSAPFDKAEPVTLEAIWIQHRYAVLVFFVAAFVVTILMVRLYNSNRIIKIQHVKLGHMARIDGLTGIGNRRKFDEVLNREWERSQRDGLPISLIMIDVDHFKLYNDKYGHQQGDECLRQIAKTIQSTLGRPSDIVTRYGGEEFVCILPSTGLEGSNLKAEQIRKAVLALGLPHSSSPTLTIVTVSLGVATLFADKALTTESLIKDADNQLYLAKRSGRNQVCSSCTD